MRMQCYCKVFIKCLREFQTNKIYSLIIKSCFQALFADTFGEKSDFIDSEISLHTFWKRNIFFAGGLFADFAVEMEMPVFVRFFVAIVVAQFVFCGCIFLNTVDDSFFFEGFQGSIDCGSVGIFEMIFDFR